MQRKRVLFAGTAGIHLSLDIPYLPMPNGNINSSGTYQFSPYGHSYLSSIAASRMGFDSVFCGNVGNDYYGDRLLSIAKNEGIPSEHIKIDKDLQTGMTIYFSERDGTHRTITFPGANCSVTGRQIGDALSCYPDALIVSSELQENAIIRASEEAASQGIPFFLDASAVGTDLSVFPFSKISRAEMLFINGKDADLFCNAEASNEERQKTACYNLFKLFPVKYVVLKLGTRGCFLYDGTFFSAYVTADSDAMDASCADEAFTAALIGEYMNTGKIESSVRFANAIASFTASRRGLVSSLPNEKEADHLRNSL